MRRLRGWWVAGVCLLAAGGPAGTRVPAAAQESGWVRLYNGRDLSGWQAKGGRLDAWKADGEMISCVAPGGGWLTTDREYGDFELKVDYRIRPGGNSGVGIRYPAQGNPAFAGIEIQILDDEAPQYKGKLKPAQYNGGIYLESAPKAHPAKPPGEWNRYEIRCQGPRIVVRLNGAEIQDVNAEEFRTAAGDGKPLAERPRRGHIGFQSHGDPVDFRNIELRELRGG